MSKWIAIVTIMVSTGFVAFNVQECAYKNQHGIISE